MNDKKYLDIHYPKVLDSSSDYDVRDDEVVSTKLKEWRDKPLDRVVIRV